MRTLAGSAALVLVLVLGSCAPRESSAPPAGSGPSPPSASPSTSPSPERTPARSDDGFDFTVETFDGDRFRLADHRGTPVVLNFWESW